MVSPFAIAAALVAAALVVSRRKSAPAPAPAVSQPEFIWNPDMVESETQPDAPWWEDWSILQAQPRGIRNHNPGNIEHTGTQWQGMAEPQHDGRFVRFVEPRYGIRALARVLGTYYRKHGIDTVRGVIDRWAPPRVQKSDGTWIVENNTDSYIRHVADTLGVSPDAPINITAPDVRRALVAAIITHENGQQPYPDSLIREGVALA